MPLSTRPLSTTPCPTTAGTAPASASRTFRWAHVAVLLPLLLLVPRQDVHAQERDAPVYQGTTYLWGAGSGGTFQPLPMGPILEVDRSFSELADDIAMVFFLSGLVRVDRLVFVGDFSHVTAFRRGTVNVPGVTPGALPGSGELRQTSLTLLGGYRLMEEPRGSLDLLGGLRAWWVNADVELAGGAVTRSPRHNFVDPLVAVRAQARLHPRWTALGYLDGGGFGVGSETTYQAVGTANFQLSSAVFLSGGYRLLRVDYESDGGSRVDLTNGGPLLGLTLRF